MRAAILLVSTLAVASSAWAQYQASTIRVSRDAHDLAWAATGSAITFTLKEVGLRPRYSALLGGLRIRVGNDVFDGSVQGRLTRLANAF